MQIVFEGIDGSGKSTLVAALESYIKNNSDKKIDSNLDRSKRPIRMLYKKMISDKNDFPSNTTSLFLSLSDYAQVMSKSDKSDVYIHDRYIYSAIVDYLTLEGRQFEKEEWYFCLQRFILPDYIFFIETTPEKVINRRKGIVSHAEAGGNFYINQANMDLKKAFKDFQGEILNNYKRIFSMNEVRERVITLNGSNEIEDNLKKILNVLEGKCI